LVSLFGIEPERVHVVYNPVVTDDIFDLARESVAHPWLAAKELPVILGVGRLEAQKDFTTLIHAFAIVRRERPCRLLILGEGNERPLLEATVHEVGLSTDVQLLGFVENPYAVMARSDVFVLSSRWEGFGNVLVEAMATGCSLVATDCPSGPREILQDGRLGPLVPPGDPAAMAAAILHSLQNPVDREALVTAARAFTAAACADGYLDVIDRHCHSRFY
jgi:glycosyltransferase involved in cell wall biosynthesis